MKILKRIGQGGFGNVDLVQFEDGTQYARKAFAQNQPLTPDLLVNVKKRFAKEVKVQSAINHPNIVPIVSSDLDSDPPTYLMPVAESSLDNDLSLDKSLNGRFVSALSDIVAGLEELHSMEIFHRDLKPQNVLRFSSDGEPIYAISDFGLISMKESNLSELTKSGMGKGSDFYTAPEISNDLRTASPRSDVYSLGCILHDMVGQEPRVPFREIRETGEFGPILSGSTKDEPSKRFPTVRAFLDAILTVEFEPSGSISVGSQDFLEMLTAEHAPKADAWRKLAEYMDSSATASDISAICGQMTADRIQAVCLSETDAAKRIGMVFADWVCQTDFNFDLCDAIANRVETFYDNGDLELKAECLIALLEMGTSHNRWYVERKFARLCGPSLDDRLAKRLIVRFHILGKKSLCSSISHLETSIKCSRTNLHPRLTEALLGICS